MIAGILPMNTLIISFLREPLQDPYSILYLLDQLYRGFFPETIVIITVLLLSVLSFSLKGRNKSVLFLITAEIGVLLALFSTVYTAIHDNNQLLFSGMYLSDALCLLFKTLILIGTGIVLAVSLPYFDQRYKFDAEYPILILSATLGAMIMAGSMDLVMMFVGIELLSISSYILASYIRTDKFCNEAGLKYLIIGSALSAIMLFGMSYLYGLTGQTNFGNIAAVIMENTNQLVFTVISLTILAGLGFKMALVPFHSWAPDVYQGAPTPFTAYLSVVSKAAGFVLALRMFTFIFMDVESFKLVLIIIAALSMLVGNILALIQSDIKRLLAYSSIAHAGYITIGLIVSSAFSFSSLIYYMIMYLFTQLGAWTCVLLFSNEANSNNIKDYSGLISKKPLLTVSFSMFLLSLAGIPITAGFFAKMYLFQAAILAGQQYLPLVLFALINSVIAMYYYLRIIKIMTIDKPSSTVENLGIDSSKMFLSSGSTTFIMGVCFSAVLIIGVAAAPVIDISKFTIEQLVNTRMNITGNVIIYK